MQMRPAASITLLSDPTHPSRLQCASKLRPNLRSVGAFVKSSILYPVLSCAGS